MSICQLGVPYNSFRFVSICFVSFCFVSFRSVSFRFDLFRFVLICFVSFPSVSFRSVSFLFRFALYRDPSATGELALLSAQPRRLDDNLWSYRIVGYKVIKPLRDNTCQICVFDLSDQIFISYPNVEFS